MPRHGFNDGQPIFCLEYDCGFPFLIDVPWGPEKQLQRWVVAFATEKAGALLDTQAFNDRVISGPGLGHQRVVRLSPAHIVAALGHEALGLALFGGDAKVNSLHPFQIDPDR